MPSQPVPGSSVPEPIGHSQAQSSHATSIQLFQPQPSFPNLSTSLPITADSSSKSPLWKYTALSHLSLPTPAPAIPKWKLSFQCQLPGATLTAPRCTSTLTPHPSCSAQSLQSSDPSFPQGLCICQALCCLPRGCRPRGYRLPQHKNHLCPSVTWVATG